MAQSFMLAEPKIVPIVNGYAVSWPAPKPAYPWQETEQWLTVYETLEEAKIAITNTAPYETNEQ